MCVNARNNCDTKKLCLVIIKCQSYLKGTRANRPFSLACVAMTNNTHVAPRDDDSHLRNATSVAGNTPEQNTLAAVNQGVAQQIAVKVCYQQAL